MTSEPTPGEPSDSEDHPFSTFSPEDTSEAMRSWRTRRLHRQIPDPAQPSALADASTGPFPKHDQRRVITGAARYACKKLGYIMPHALETTDGEVGAETLHPTPAWLAFEVACIFCLHQDERLLSRDKRIEWLTKPDDHAGVAGEFDPEHDSDALPSAPDRATIVASMVREPGMPNRIARSFGFDPREEPCRAGRDGILYWVHITGEEWENTRVTRSRPADGSPFKQYEVVRAELGPALPDDEWTASAAVGR